MPLKEMPWGSLAEAKRELPGATVGQRYPEPWNTLRIVPHLCGNVDANDDTLGGYRPGSGPVSLLAAASLAAGVSVLATAVVRRLAPRWGLVDRANERSSHQGVVARGGGVGLVVGAAAGLALAAPPVDRSTTAVVLGGAIVSAFVGLAADRRGLSPFVRLACHMVVAIVVVAVAGGLDRLPLPFPLDVPLGPLGAALAVVWIVAAVNFYNFLDGIDGLAGVQAVVTGAGIALAAWEPFAAALGASLAGAALGFLLHNWSPSRIFLGDAGSGVLGFFFAAAPLLAAPESRPGAVTFVAASLFFFLADATWTLAARLARGARFYEAHREHVYQRLVIGGYSHPRVTLMLGLGALLVTLLALVAWRRESGPLAWAALALGASGFGAEVVFARRVAGPVAASGGARA
jgi:Fuc2NAc and GlcNAc transferase